MSLPLRLQIHRVGEAVRRDGIRGRGRTVCAAQVQHTGSAHALGSRVKLGQAEENGRPEMLY